MYNDSLFPYLKTQDKLISECHRIETILQAKQPKSDDHKENSLLYSMPNENEFLKYKKEWSLFVE